MRAVVRDRYGPPEVLEVVELEVPEPSAGEILVAVRASSINTADLDNVLGRPRAVRVISGLRQPRSNRSGVDVAGEVAAVGDGVTDFAPGDEVWADLFAGGFGAFSEYVCAPEGIFARKPAGVSFEDAATVPHSAVLALQALEGRGRLTAGMNVLVNGGGGLVGPWAIQLAKVSGCEVTAVDHTDKLALMEEAGADHVIDFTNEDFRTNGVRYDLIVDIAATRSVLSFRRSLATDGGYVLVARGVFGFFQAALLGGLVSVSSRTRMGIFMWKPSARRDLARLGDLLERGAIRPLIGHHVDLENVPKALRLTLDGSARGKIVVTTG